MKPFFIRLTMFAFIALGTLILFYIGGIYYRSLFLVVAMMTLLWGLSLRLKDSSIVDAFWGVGFVIVNWCYFAWATDFQFDHIRGQVLAAMVTLWGVRLSLHIGLRNAGKPEDKRYQAFRAEAGAGYWWYSLFKVFLLQGIILWNLSSIFWLTHYSTIPTLGTFEYIGIALFAVGFFFETVGDWQLRRFQQRPTNKGKVLKTGLWRYSRHPNYFGEAVIWWGFFLFALGTKGGWLYVFVPFFMNFLLRFLSGVPMLEEDLQQTKPEYKNYMRETSAFLPMPPRKLK
jgi:steroid 5-alpha reductase family enzyme